MDGAVKQAKIRQQWVELAVIGRNLVISFFLGLSLACGSPEPQKSASETLGGTAPLGNLISFPQPKRPAELASFADKIKTFFGQKKLSKSVDTSQKKTFLGQIYLKALVAADGVNRDQGEKALKDLVAKDSTQCGGASCAAVFGVAEKDIPQFFDELLAKAGTSQALATVEKQAVRRTIVSSLMPKGVFDEGAPYSTQVARLYFEIPATLPKQGPRPQGILWMEDILNRTSVDFVYAIQDFTSMHDFIHIRRVESLDRNTLHNLGMADEDIAIWRRKSEVINTGLKKLPIVDAPVYRGLVGLNEDTIGLWYKAWKERQVIGLGYDNKGSVSSASWQVGVATEFIKPNLRPDGSTTKFAALLEIRSHRGVSIEYISEIPSEFEVILPRDQKVIIEHMSFILGAQKTVLIKMRGVNSASVSPRERGLWTTPLVSGWV